MSPDGITIHLLIKELQPLINGRVERVHHPEDHEIILNIRSSGKNYRLLLSAQADSARIHLTSQEKTNPPVPPQFCLILRKFLEGSRLLRIDQIDLDRVVHLTFSRIDESGEFREVILISEIMGKHSNIILIDPLSGTIIDGIKRYSHTLSRYREVLPGRPYLPPPSQKKEHPAELSLEKFLKIILEEPLEQALEDAVFRRIAGIGKELVNEAIYRANLDPQLRLEYCGEYELRSLWNSLQGILFPLLFEGNTTPTIIYDGKRPICYAPVELTRYQGLNTKKCDTINQMLDEFYAERSAILRFQQLQNNLQSVIKREIDRCTKKLHLQEEAEAEAKQADAYRIQGEMLLAHLHLVKPGQKEVLVPNLYEPDTPLIRIELDPSLSPTQNAQKLFKKYNKARDSLKLIRNQIELTREELIYLTSVKTALENSETLSDLEEIKSELEETGYIKTRNGARGSLKEKKSSRQILRLISRDGLEIFIGKNNKQNDYLTMRLAKDNDLWLHVKDAAGAHVIVKAPPDGEIPETTLEEAAQLAAYFSEARHSSKAAVDYTKRKYVTKPPGARPGFVIYRNHKTIMVKPKPPAEALETN
ncbi:MAG: Rqc2 family fibronectin-binding protein [Thermacetogeniaceae bacterium]